MKRLNRDKTPTDLGYKKIDEITAKLAALREVANTDEFRAIANAMESFRGNGTPGIDNYSWDKWEFSAYVSGLHSFQDKEVIDLKEIISALDPDDEVTNEYKDSNNVDVIYTFKFEKDVMIKVTLNLYLSSSSPLACRKVQVGTEMKEVPVYKSVCSADLSDVSGELPAPVLQLEKL